MRRRGPWLFVTVDHENHLALVRGADAEKMTRLLVDDPSDICWSPGARGWVVSSSAVGDLVAYAEHHHLLLVISNWPAKAAS